MALKKDTVTIDYFVEKEREKSYINIPFEIYPNLERIDIAYSYEGDGENSIPIGEKNVFDLAVTDWNGNDVGATGSAHRKISIGESFSSGGYKRMTMREGTWHIVLGAYLVKNGGTTVHFTLTYYYKEYRWLRGDTHIHTKNSDGRLSYAEAGALAKEKGLDFLFITDHNNIAQDTLPLLPDITLIPGVELTHYNGHINYLGAQRPYVGSYSVNSFEGFLDLNKQAAGSGAVRVINHPNCSVCPWKWQFDFAYEGLEVWNGPMRRDNLNNIALWEDQLRKGRKLIALGGSDFHKMNFLLGIPISAVYALSSAPSDILDAIGRGRVSILNTPKSPLLFITSGENVQGDTVTFAEGLTVKVVCDNLKRGQILIVYNQDGEMFRHTANRNSPCEFTLDVTSRGYVRAEVRYKPKLFNRLFQKIFDRTVSKGQTLEKIKTLVYSLTNPIFFE